MSRALAPGPFSVFKAGSHIPLTSVSVVTVSFSWKDPDLSCKAWEMPAPSSQLEILNEITPAKSLWPHQVTYAWVPVIRTESSMRGGGGGRVSAPHAGVCWLGNNLSLRMLRYGILPSLKSSSMRLTEDSGRLFRNLKFPAETQTSRQNFRCLCLGQESVLGFTCHTLAPFLK